MHGRHRDRMCVNYVPGIRVGTMENGSDAPGEIKVCRDYAHRGTCGAGISVPGQRCFHGTRTPRAPAALSADESRDQHIAAALPGLGQKRPQAGGRRLLGQRVQAVSVQDERGSGPHKQANVG